MKIVLEPPFTNDYKAAYVVTNKEPRRVAVLVRTNGTITSMAFARYELSCKIGRYLTPTEQADHIDENRMNDSRDNLQILTCDSNNAKSRKHRNISRKMIDLICPGCWKTFARPHNLTHLCRGNFLTTCSKECIATVLKRRLSKEELKRIGQIQILKSYRKTSNDRPASESPKIPQIHGNLVCK